MFRWVPYAMVRITLFFMGGILLAIYQPALISEEGSMAMIGGLALLYLLVRVFKGSERLILGTIGLSLIFFFGYLNVLLRTDSRNNDHFVHAIDPIDYYEAVVIRYAESKERTWKIESQVRKIKAGGKWENKTGKVLLYFSKEDFKEPPRYGDVFLVRGAPGELTGPANPGEFDYKRFLTFRKIYHQHFLRNDFAHQIDNDPPNRLLQATFALRHWADAKLKSVVTNERDAAVASALVLGVTDGLDNELLQAYAATGALHVLSVSGLHVGIIYAILLLLLKPLNKTRKGKWLLAIINILVLWIYAFVTGVSPSVLRAVTMFSFVALARPWKQTSNIYNTLAASALCLLAFEPYLMMSVGFQLSYMAVLGIVALQPLIYRWWEPASRFWDEVWKITSVSIAAQAATFALGLLYFHQFPNYFLFSNLLVIPISTFVLLAGLAVLAVSFVTPLFLLLGVVLEWSIKIMNYIVLAVESMPFSLMENIYIDTFQCWLLIGMTVMLSLLFSHRQFVFLPIAFVLVCIFVSTQFIHLTKDVAVRKFTVYKVAGHSAIDLIDRGTATFVTDSVLWADVDRIRFHIQPNRLFHSITKVQKGVEPLKDLNGLRVFTWHGESFAQITSHHAPLPSHLSVNWLIISNNSVKSVEELMQKIHCKGIIIDSSNTYYFADRILKEAADHVPVHSVLHQGAFSYSL